MGHKKLSTGLEVGCSDDKNDLKEVREETKKLMVLDYSSLNEETLVKHLYNPDMRIRQKAQFQLVARGEKGLDVFKTALVRSKINLPGLTRCGA